MNLAWFCTMHTRQREHEKGGSLENGGESCVRSPLGVHKYPSSRKYTFYTSDKSAWRLVSDKLKYLNVVYTLALECPRKTPQQAQIRKNYLEH